jgi:hypothetical protein
MIQDGQKTSLLISSQLPGYIQDNPDYANFSLFLQAYYEWMEQNGKVTERSKNLLSYKDIDRTTNEFLDYYINDFLPYFPKDTLISKQSAVKIAKQLYKNKGTPASYEFLFRILYNSDFDVFYTKDAVFKPSAGQWYITKSLRLLSNNPNFLSTKNLRLFGINSKSIATIENCVLSGDKTEVFISNIERLFETGEFVRVVDANNQDVLFDDEVLSAKVVGQINQIRISPTRRGLFYQPGDPVILHGGVESNTAIEATAIVSDATKGSISRINTVNGGFGYRAKPNTRIDITNAGTGVRANVFSLSNYLPPPLIVENGGKGYNVNDKLVYQDEAFAVVTSVNAIGSILTTSYSQTVNSLAILNITANVSSSNANAAGAIIRTGTTLGKAAANVSMVPLDVIGFKRNITIGNTQYNFSNLATANANTTFLEAFTFSSLETYPISSVLVENSGGGINQIPQISAVSLYQTEDTFDEFSVTSDLSKLGVLGPIQISNGGKGYQINDLIVFTGGQGQGANAVVANVDANGAITETQYTYLTTSNTYPLGGLGYTNKYLPKLNVVSANVQASGADLYVPGILGTGAQFSVVADRVGSITSIAIQNFGEDYESTPNVSLRIQDIAISNVSISNLPKKGEIVYQGPSVELSSYRAKVNNVTLLSQDVDPGKSLYNLRVYDYTSTPNTSLVLSIQDKNLNYTPANTSLPQFETSYRFVDVLGNVTVFKRNYNEFGVITYGDGTARANASFLNGLTIGSGQYLTTQGQASSYDVLQDENYNNYTYLITVEKEIAKYREVLLNLLHPSGTKVLGRYALKANNKVDIQPQQALYAGQPLRYYFGTNVSDAVDIVADFTNKSNNIIKFKTTLGTDISNFIFANQSYISIQTKNGPNVYSKVVAVEPVSNTIQISSNIWMTYSNVAYVTGNSGSNVLNITSLTGLYDMMNNGNYSDPDYPLRDIVFATDKVLVANNTSKVVGRVDAVNNLIYLTTNLSANANSLLSVNRTFLANSSITYDEIKIFGPLGTSYVPYLVTQSGDILTTQAGELILLG